jgi:hypothetical protein
VGTTFCIHCRRDARIAARIKRQRLMLRGGAAAIVVATFATATAFGATAIRSRNTARRADSSAPVAAPTPTTPSVTKAATTTATPADSAKPVALVAPAAPPAPLTPIVPAGESTLLDGITALRSDSVVTVSFDLPMIRTRIPEKFERFVRSTLPQIYGAGVDSSLAKLPVGAIARQGDLLTELPARGIHIPVGGAWEVRVLPIIRPGVEGPLVVKYRTMVCGNGPAECAGR